MTRRLLSLILAIVLIAAACGGDDDSSDDTATDDSSQSSDDSGGSDDSGSDSSASDDSGGSDDSGSDTPTLFNCDDVRDALERAGNSVDPTGGSDDLEASFNESRAQLEALAQEAPELSDDVDAALEGMDAIGEALAALDWDTSNLATDPEAALEFASLLSDPAVSGMTQALSNISAWVASSCA